MIPHSNSRHTGTLTDDVRAFDQERHRALLANGLKLNQAFFFYNCILYKTGDAKKEPNGAQTPPHPVFAQTVAV
jgi:hypothetical protein